MANESYLMVPGKWLDVCGHGSEDRVFPVIRVERGYLCGNPATFVIVNRDGTAWVVHKEWRNARFVDAN